MTEYRKIDELWEDEDHKKVSQLVRKHHFYTAWKNTNKSLALEITHNIKTDFNEWKAEKENIANAFIWRKASWTDKGGWWEQVEGCYELMHPNFDDRVKEDWHLMYCFNHNYKRARYEFISLIIGNY